MAENKITLGRLTQILVGSGINLNEIYNDEGGHYVNFVLNGKARLPKKIEIMNSGCSTSCPTWLLVNSIDPCYWSLATNENYDYYSLFMTSTGYGTGGLSISSLSVGVRPVITVSKYKIKN